jgi:hypothetical protein
VHIRCTLDGLLLEAHICPRRRALVAFDGDEGFVMEAVEAAFYEVVCATPDELLLLQQAHYRLLQPARDFRTASNTLSTCSCEELPSRLWLPVL